MIDQSKNVPIGRGLALAGTSLSALSLDCL
jgi:hypothetical protein